MKKLSLSSLQFLANSSLALEPWREDKSVWLQCLCFWILYRTRIGACGFHDVMLYSLGSALSLWLHLWKLLDTFRMIMTFALSWPYLNLYVKLEEVSCFLTKPWGPTVLLTDLKSTKFDLDSRAIVLTCLRSLGLK